MTTKLGPTRNIVSQERKRLGTGLVDWGTHVTKLECGHVIKGPWTARPKHGAHCKECIGKPNRPLVRRAT